MGIETGWRKKYSHSESYSEDYELELFSSIPFVPYDVRKAGKDALSFAYRTYADALVTEELGNVITSHPEYAPDMSKSKLLVLWKPKPSEIHVKAQKIEKDPALVLTCNKPYLVKTWSIPDEEPFMNIINACKVSDMKRYLKK